ncbi:MAG TPA: hypothetical protein DIW30_02015 [Bacteroidales bacterium]|nr:hypothetical protein [Bacteroidales bacterium]
MKPTLTINLNGLVFHIDEDAYRTLNDYLDAVRRQVGGTEDTEEIMLDVEARIAELFADMLQHKGMQVVNSFMVRQVMEQLGRPEDFSSSEENTDAGMTQPKTNNAPQRHRLYRDVDNAILGGVCSGLAAYLGWDVVWIRLLFVLCTFLWGAAIPVYLLVWLIAPAAQTAAQRLEMRGEVASVENIKREYEKAAKYAEEHQVANRARRAFGIFLKIILFAVLACVAIPLLGVVVAVVAVLFAMCMAMLSLPFGMFDAVPAFADFPAFFMHPWMAVVAVLLLLLALGIPLFIAIYWLVKYAKKRQHPSSLFWIVTLSLWLLSSVGLGILAVYAGKSWRNIPVPESFESDWMSCNNAVTVQPFTKIKVMGAACLQVSQADSCSVLVSDKAPALLTTRVENETLFVETVENINSAPSLRITLPEWQECSVEGAAQILTDGTIHSDKLHISVEGAATLDADLDVKNLSMSVEGAAVSKLVGKAKSFRLSQDGMAVTHAASLVADVVNVSCDGMSVAEVLCTQKLIAEADGMSKILYSGSPADCNVTKDGMATIKPM